MNLNNLKSSDSMTFRAIACRLLSPGRILSERGRIRYANGSRFELITKDTTYAFVIEDPADAAEITAHMAQRQQNLAQVISQQQGNGTIDNRIFYLHIVFFGSTLRVGSWYVALDAGIQSALQKMRLGKTREEMEKALKRNFCLNNGSRDCFAITIGKYHLDDFAPPEVPEERALPEAREPESPAPAEEDPEMWIGSGEDSSQLVREKSIILYGMDFSLLVRVQGREGEEFLRAVRVDSRNRHRPTMILAIGDLEFQDHQNLIGSQVRKQLSSVHGYLDLWSRYASAEGDFLLKRVRTVGAFEIKATAPAARGLELYPRGLQPEAWKYLVPGEQLLFSSEIPVYLQEDMTWEEYQLYLDDLRRARDQDGQTVQREKGELFNILSAHPNEGYLVLDGQGASAPQSRIVSLSIVGNKTQIDRRRAARSRIENGESENPSLGLIIEGILPDLSDGAGPARRIGPLSPLVMEKVFKSNPPTQTQRDAIDIALNTPDIAIIQGPPGTGKTTVITAIIERLNEIADHRKSNQGSVLVTSFQHDAVRNVIDRLRINSLLTIKFGQKSNDDQDVEAAALSEWCGQYADRLRALNPGLRETEEQRTLAKLRAGYIANPGTENALRILEFAKGSQNGQLLEPEISDLIDSLKQNESESGRGLLPQIRRLRTSKEAFLDDGPDVAYALFHDLRRKFKSKVPKRTAHILDTLERAADCTGAPDEELLRELKAAQRELLQSCIPVPPYYQETPREDILDLCDRLARFSERPSDEKEKILYALLGELEHNPERVRETIAAYDFVYAATTQQCEGWEIRKAKNALHEGEHPAYDTVIVDEAARANPGDLLIPMAQAGCRIILVGDHRQLPHIYDEEIFESMQTDGIEVDKNVVKQSMFQYLLQKAEELTCKDHIRRTISLDAQYRTHPMLGNFVSDNFYAPYHEGFESPRLESEFEQGLWPKPLKWVNLPASIELQKKFGTSWVRNCEAEYIADTLSQYLESPEGRELKYGVITFYSAQRDLIIRRLQQKLGERAQQIRVGSVDAFQGMEFDVIFLSIVRCRNRNIQADWALLERDADRENGEFLNWSKERQEIGLRHYGFLISQNRLCVALSRQKKLLIIVGDAGAFLEGDWGRLAALCVPALRRLAEKCKDEGVLVDGKA